MILINTSIKSNWSFSHFGIKIHIITSTDRVEIRKPLQISKRKVQKKKCSSTDSALCGFFRSISPIYLFLYSYYYHFESASIIFCFVSILSFLAYNVFHFGIAYDVIDAESSISHHKFCCCCCRWHFLRICVGTGRVQMDKNHSAQATNSYRSNLISDYIVDFDYCKLSSNGFCALFLCCSILIRSTVRLITICHCVGHSQ